MTLWRCVILSNRLRQLIRPTPWPYIGISPLTLQRMTSPATFRPAGSCRTPAACWHSEGLVYGGELALDVRLMWVFSLRDKLYFRPEIAIDYDDRQGSCLNRARDTAGGGGGRWKRESAWRKTLFGSWWPEVPRPLFRLPTEGSISPGDGSMRGQRLGRWLRIEPSPGFSQNVGRPNALKTRPGFQETEWNHGQRW